MTSIHGWGYLERDRGSWHNEIFVIDLPHKL